MKQEIEITNKELEILVKNRTIELQEVNEQLKNEITKHKKTEESLGERVKELRCLYNLSSLDDHLNSSEDEILSKAIIFIPPGWQYPEITCSRIILNDREFITDNFQETEWKQRGEITINGEVHGSLEVFYLEEKPEAVEGPFLKEERNLIDELCDRLGKIIGHKRAEKALITSEKRFSSFMEHLPGTATIKDKKNCYLYYNHVFAEIFGIEQDEWIGRSVEETFSPGIASGLKAKSLKIFSDGLPVEEEQYFQRGDRDYYFLNTKFPIFDENGDIEAVGSIRIDTTSLNMTLTELEEAREAADNANRTKSTFLANMSHELRTPLNAILGFSQLLGLDQDNLNSQQIEFLEHIKHSSNHLLEMVNDILDLSKIEAGKYDINKKPFNLGQMLSRLPMAVKSLAYEKGIELIVDINFIDELIQADEVRLKQVLFNLLSNAIKFTNPGKKIGISAASVDNEAEIKIWDEGRGINTNDLKKVFDPFEQVGRADSHGTGLGLAISRKLIELHGGTLAADSRIGEGSSFIIRIPGIIFQSKKEIEQKKAEASTKKKTLKMRGTILIIEDNLIHQKVIEATLIRLGFNSHSEVTGLGGIEAVRKKAFDLVLMDIQLPGMNGVDTMKLMRKEGKKRIPIVALTAYAMKGDLEKFRSEGFDGYISKPIVIKRLEETLDTLLR